MRRRGFLKLSAASAAALAAPTLWLPKRARAATEAFGAARHVLVLFAKGGLRSHCVFNAVGAPQHNPFGRRSASDGTAWALGAACDDVEPATSLGVVPGFSRITPDVTVLGTVDHQPGGPPEVDHRAGVNRIATGLPDGRIGLLTQVGVHHPAYAQGFTKDALPPVEIRPTEFGRGDGEASARRPLSLLGADAAFSSQSPVGRGWKIQARAALDERFLASRAPAFEKRLSGFRASKAAATLFADLLVDPRLQVIAAPDAAHAGVTNAQLLEVLGDHDLAEIGDPQSIRSWGADVAMALRFFSFGSPMCVVTRDVYDLHDAEAVAFRPRVTDLCRQLAGLHFLLQRMPHEDGGTYWDKTLVVVLSEFSRNNTFPETGFNSGNGSDHVPEGAGPQRNQAIAMMGGVLARRGALIGATDEQIEALDGSTRSTAVLATLLDVLGIDPLPIVGDRGIEELFR